MTPYKKRIKVQTIITLFILIAILSSIIIFSSIRKHYRIKTITKEAFDSATNNFAASLHFELNFLSNSLLELSQQNAFKSQKTFSNSTEYLIKMFKFVKCINLVNNSFIVRFSAPYTKNRYLIGAKLPMQNPKCPLVIAKKFKHPAISHPLETLNNKTIYSWVLPVKDNFLQIIISSNYILNDIRKFLRTKDFLLEVFDGKRMIYKTNGYLEANLNYPSYQLTTTFKLLDRSIKICAIPSESLIKNISSKWHIIIYTSIAIMILVIILTIVIQFSTIKFQNKIHFTQEKLIQELAETKNKLKEKNEELYQKSTIDFLTDIYNRRQLIKRLSKIFYDARRYNHYFALLMFDIDNFKNINDSYGHHAGDITLQATADILKKIYKKKRYLREIRR